MRIILLIILSILFCRSIFGQTISERLILTDNKDSLYMNSNYIAFDKNGNYCFVIKQNGKEFFITPTDTIGGFNFINSISGNGGVLNYTTYPSAQKNEKWYYKNAKGTKVYGTAIGQLENYQTSNTKGNVAITTSLNDSVYFYINSKLISKLHKGKIDKHYGFDGEWCALSENGNNIYFLQQDTTYFLYVNGKQIDSSKFRYYQLAINDNGEYIFAQGEQPEPKVDVNDYMFFIHSVDTILEYVRTVWYYELKNNGAYYYSGSNNGDYYIAINNKLQKGIESISNITLIDKDKFLYSYFENKHNKINVNGKNYNLDFDEIFYPVFDKKGNFALYGLKDYYLYKYINGKKEENPISKFGSRPIPLYISSEGKSIHYFKTDDSIYLYQDDKLLFEPISINSNFKVVYQNEFYDYSFKIGEKTIGNSLIYMEYDSIGYLFFNGILSNPMLPIKTKSYSNNIKQGEIVAGELTENGFFIIQKLDTLKYMININNQTYYELDGVDKILNDNTFFDGKELIIYEIKGLSFYQFKLKQ